MQIISGTTEINWEQHTAVAIGKFDGIHQGHRRLLDQIIRAKEDGLAESLRQNSRQRKKKGVFLKKWESTFWLNFP